MQDTEEQLSERKQQILLCSVESYISKASPITSGNIQERVLKDVSTATLRNELAALEAMGYLKQLHTSGGRVPTSKGYRYYVNYAMGDMPTDKKVLKEIHGIFDKRAVYLTDVLAEIASTVSKATNYPTVVMLKGFEKLVIKNVKIIPLISNQALILIETSGGIINNSMDITHRAPDQSYTDASNLLTNTFKDKTVADMIANFDSYQNGMMSELKEFKSIFDNFISTINNLLDSIKKGGLTSGGEMKLLESPEYSDVEKARKVIEVLSDKDEICNILSDEGFAGNSDVSFKIGSEIKNKKLADCSIAKAEYSVGGESVASIGIIGPQRMDYQKIASALRFVVGEYKGLAQIEQKKEDKK
ncbi:MAG: heat-inducible transcriptional repressor HrcA [Firmicutes bacterium]|nr:heat-inducible transcriptional repressor HrcA [Bacillota bacterium]